MLTSLHIVSLWWLIPSTILMVIIHQYIKKKPPGLQSVLDLMIMILLKVNICHNGIICLVASLQLTHGQLNVTSAKFLIFLRSNVGVLSITGFQVILGVKAMLIFKPHWLAEQTDSEVVRKSSVAALVYTSTRFILDFILTPSRTSTELELLVGVQVQT